MVPVPRPVLTATVRLAPVPEMVPMEAAASPPPVVSARLLAVTFCTGALKVTVKVTEAAIVGDGTARVIELTVMALVVRVHFAYSVMLAVIGVAKLNALLSPASEYQPTKV